MRYQHTLVAIRNYFTLRRIGTVVHFHTTCLLPQLNHLVYFFIKSPLCKIVTFSHKMGLDIRRMMMEMKIWSAGAGLKGSCNITPEIDV